MKNQKHQKTTVYVAILCSSLISLAALGATFPKTPEGMSSKTAKEMTALPDVKVKLGEPLKESAFKGKSETELSLMRNSIAAQAGFEFTEPWLKNYFSSRSWYKPGNYDPKNLKPVDQANVQMIMDYQKAHGLWTANKGAERHIAAQPDPREHVFRHTLKMRYCDFSSDDGNYQFTLHFHFNGTVNASKLEISAYDGSYYSSGEAPSIKGNWKVTEDGNVIVTLNDPEKHLKHHEIILKVETENAITHKCTGHGKQLR
jgi:hypothetical protein